MSEGLTQLLAEITRQENDAFTTHDVEQVQRAIDQATSHNERLAAINHVIEQRHAVLTRLNQEYNLTTTHPDLMRMFATQQHRYMQLRDQIVAGVAP